MSNELFTDLSTEQQEVVAGGVDVIQGTDYASLLKIDTSSFKAVGPVYSGSGPNGSFVNSTGAVSIDKTSIFAALATDSIFAAHA